MRHCSGISRDKILVTTREAGDGDLRVDVSYIAYTAHTQACGDWSENLAFTADNHAARISAARCSTTSPPWWPIRATCWARGAMGPVDTNRRATVMDHYEKGEVTQADKHTQTSRFGAVRRRLRRRPVTRRRRDQR